jgi:ferredoxin
MKIHVDSGKCTGHARCAMKAPDVYVLNDEGFNHMGDFEVKPGLEKDALLGARSCPEKAIDVIGD